MLGFALVGKWKIFRRRNHPKYKYIFNTLYNRTSLQNSFEYTNPYEQRRFSMRISDSFDIITEYVFLCPFRDLSTLDLAPIYVSKPYNVSPFADGSYMPSRFVIGNLIPTYLPAYNNLILAEEPVVAYEKSDFNVELHYLRLRKYVKPGKCTNVDTFYNLM